MDNKTAFFRKQESYRLLLKTAGYNNQGTGFKRSTARHSHDLWSMDLCISGSSDLEIDFRHYTCKRGDIILIPPGVKHRFVYTKDAFSCYSFKLVLPGIDLPENISIYAGNPEGLKQRLAMIEAAGCCLKGSCPEKILDLHAAFPVNSSFPGIHVLEELLYGIFCHFIYGDARIAPEYQEEKLVRKISEFVYLHGGKNVTAEEVAAYLNFSPGYLRTLVKKNTGKSTKKLIDLERIKIMKEHLLYSDIYISELAELMEFKDTKYFTRFFRKYTGKCPRDWLRNEKKTAEKTSVSD